MVRTFLSALVAALLLTTAATAQQPTKPGQSYVEAAARNNITEIALGNLAVQKAGDYRL